MRSKAQGDVKFEEFGGRKELKWPRRHPGVTSATEKKEITSKAMVLNLAVGPPGSISQWHR